MIDSNDIGKIDEVIKSLKKLKKILSVEILEIVKDLDKIAYGMPDKKKQKLHRIVERLEDLEFLIKPLPRPKFPPLF